MIQGGGLTRDMENKKGQLDPIKNEADNGLSNLKYTVAMARTSDPHSATSQFFINTKDNKFLDHTAKDLRGWGYCVFGKVVSGQDGSAFTGLRVPFQRTGFAAEPGDRIFIIDHRYLNDIRCHGEARDLKRPAQRFVADRLRLCRQGIRPRPDSGR